MSILQFQDLVSDEHRAAPYRVYDLVVTYRTCGGRLLVPTDLGGGVCTLHSDYGWKLVQFFCVRHQSMAVMPDPQSSNANEELAEVQVSPPPHWRGRTVAVGCLGRKAGVCTFCGGH